MATPARGWSGGLSSLPGLEFPAEFQETTDIQGKTEGRAGTGLWTGGAGDTAGGRQKEGLMPTRQCGVGATAGLPWGREDGEGGRRNGVGCLAVEMAEPGGAQKCFPQLPWRREGASV